MKKNNNNALKKYIEKIIKPILEKVPQETKINPTSVGHSQKISNIYSLYNPHNYRLYFDFEKVNFHPLRPTDTNLQRSVGRFRRLGIVNKKEWTTDENILNCTLIVKKSLVEIKNKTEHKRWYLIKMGNIEQRKQQIYDIHLKKINEAKKALKSFIEIYGGKSNFELKRIWCEEKVMQDKPIDRLPLNMFFKAKNVKKEYNEPNIEFFGDPVGAANYFSNRGIEDIAPQIAQEIKNMGIAFFERVTPPIEQLAQNLDTHVKVLKDLSKGFKKFNKLLSERQKKLREF